jgi:hypothetical protein
MGGLIICGLRNMRKKENKDGEDVAVGIGKT